MIKLVQATCASVGSGDFSQAIELGFVPTRVEIVNRTTLCKLLWTDNTDTSGYLQNQAGSTIYSVDFTLTAIDGSDKVNYLTNSFGFLLPTIVDLNDTAAEVLDIAAFREDV